MIEIKRVLFTTDFSQAANTALPHALKIAQQYGANITILHVATPYAHELSKPEYQYHYLDQGNYEKYVDESMSELFQTIGSPQEINTTITRDRSSASGILSFIEQNGIDLIVMGTHGRSAIAHFLLGSVSEKIVRYAPCPVLTVAQGRDNYQNNPEYQHVLVAFDFSEHSKEAARKAKDIASTYGARLQALHVIEQEVHPAYYYRWKESMIRDLPQIAAEAKESLQASLGEEGIEDLDIQVEIGEGKVHKEISQFAREHRVDLIVMGTHGLSGVERMLLGSTTERLVRIASCPVLTVKPQAD